MSEMNEHKTKYRIIGKKNISVIAVRILVPTFAYCGAILGYAWAENAFNFISGIAFALVLLALSPTKPDREKIKSPSLPQWTLSLPIAITIIVTVYAGWFWTASAWTLNWFFIGFIRTRDAVIGLSDLSGKFTGENQ